MRYWLIIFAFIATVNADAQNFRARFEMGFMGGGSYYIGDLNPTKHFIYSKPAGGMIVRVNMTTRWSFRFTGTYGSVWADDAKSSDPFQQNRNLNFRSNIMEIAAGFEVNWLKYMINSMKYPFTPYFFYEVAYFHMNPYGTQNGITTSLQSLATEGQGTALNPDKKRRYNVNQMSIPLGIGFKFNLRERLAVSLEYGIRMTFTDYLDDVSGSYVDHDQLRAVNGPLSADFADPSLRGVGSSPAGYNRGNPATKDWYAFYGAMLTFKPFKRRICEFNQRF